MEENKNDNKQKELRPDKTYRGAVVFATGATLSLGLIALFAFLYIKTTPRLETTMTIVKDGQVIEGLTVDDIVIIPGETTSYEVTMYNRLVDNYNILVSYKGEDSSIYDYITTSVVSDHCSLETGLNDIVNKGYQTIGRELLSEEVGVNFTISYHFSEDLTEELIKPFSLTLNFKIEH